MIRIELPWPAKELSPNSRVHWSKKAKATKSAKLTAEWTLTTSVCRPVAKPGYAVHYTFHPSDNRRRDLDNAIASTKSYTDGIARFIGIDDSTFRLSYSMGEVRKPGCVVVEIS